MLRVNPDGQNILFVAFAIVEVGGFLVLFFRWYWTIRTYLRRFAGKYRILAYEPAFIPAMFYPTELVKRLLRERQDDPELEQLRRAVRRRYGYVVLWTFGFPLLVAGVLALLILSGLVTFTG